MGRRRSEGLVSAAAMSRRGFVTGVVGGAVSLAACASPLGAEGKAGPLAADVAVPFERPPGAPGAADVSMRSLRFRPLNRTDPRDTFAAMDAFHATRLEWVYVGAGGADRQRIERVKEGGRVFGAAAGAQTGLGGIPRDEALKLSVLAVDGSPVVAEHMKGWRGRPTNGCVNNPGFEARHFGLILDALRSGAEAIQRDDTAANYAFAQSGIGCYCRYCLGGFRRHLGATLDAAERGRLGVGEVAAFDYAARLRARAPAGFDWSDVRAVRARLRDEPLARHFLEFQQQSTRDFYGRLRAAVAAALGRPVPLSCNYTSVRPWEPALFRDFDFAISELSIRNANPVHIYTGSRAAVATGKVQVFGSPKTLGLDHDRAAMLRLRRTVIATAYASGALARVPWDLFMESRDGEDRLFGEPEEFADLYGFVRGVSRYLDGYADAGAFGRGLDERRYGATAPVVPADGGEDLFCFVRAVPGDGKAPVVVHLVDWAAEPRARPLRLRSGAFFAGGIGQARLLTPMAYDRQLHVDAEARAQALRSGGERLSGRQAGAYEGLVRTTTLGIERRGEYAGLTVPALAPWGVLVLEPHGRT